MKPRCISSYICMWNSYHVTNALLSVPSFINICIILMEAKFEVGIWQWFGGGLLIVQAMSSFCQIVLKLSNCTPSADVLDKLLSGLCSQSCRVRYCWKYIDINSCPCVGAFVAIGDSFSSPRQNNFNTSTLMFSKTYNFSISTLMCFSSPKI